MNKVATLNKFLSQKFPEAEMQREQKGQVLKYIPWHRIVGILNSAIDAGALDSWEYWIEDISYGQAGPGTKDSGGNEELLKKTVVVRVGLRLIVNGHGIVRQGAGFEYLAHSGYGDPVSNATSMALRRAAAMFGIGLYLYEKEQEEREIREVKQERVVAGPPTKPVISDGVFDLPRPTESKFPPSEKQWKYLTSLMNEKGYTDLDGIVEMLLNEGQINSKYVTGWEDLSGKDVGTIINWLLKEEK